MPVAHLRGSVQKHSGGLSLYLTACMGQNTFLTVKDENFAGVS